MVVPVLLPAFKHSQTLVWEGLGREQSCGWMAKPGALDVQGFDGMMGSN